MRLPFRKFKQKPIVMDALELTEDVHDLVAGDFLATVSSSNEPRISAKIVKRTINIGDCELSAISELKEKDEFKWIDKYFLIKRKDCLELECRVELGDYLLEGIKGEVWTVDPEQFHTFYEEV